MAQHHSIGITRPWEPGTVAIVTWDSDTVWRADNLLARIKTALRAWVGEAEEGNDYNIGDLSGDLHDPRLITLLANQDIHNLEITTASSGPTWDFDEHLLSEEE